MVGLLDASPRPWRVFGKAGNEIRDPLVRPGACPGSWGRLSCLLVVVGLGHLSWTRSSWCCHAPDIGVCTIRCCRVGFGEVEMQHGGLISTSDPRFRSRVDDYVQCKTLGKRGGCKFNGRHAPNKPSDTACAGLHRPFGLFILPRVLVHKAHIDFNFTVTKTRTELRRQSKINGKVVSAKIESNALDSSRHLNRRWDRRQTQPSHYPHQREDILLFLWTLRVQSFLISLHSFQNIRSQKYTTSVHPSMPVFNNGLVPWPSLPFPFPIPIPHSPFP
jgi:hypothetical protein